MSKRIEENKSSPYQLEGSEALGSYLRIIPRTDSAIDISECSIQWFRISPEGSKKELILGKCSSSSSFLSSLLRRISSHVPDFGWFIRCAICYFHIVLQHFLFNVFLT